MKNILSTTTFILILLLLFARPVQVSNIVDITAR